MFILSPKTNFLGGSLVSASHLGKLFPGKLLTWKHKSPFLDANGVTYKVINSDTVDLGNTIWCNDTCLDKGYQPGFEYNRELYEFLSKFDKIYLVNHQPPNRMYEYFIKCLELLRGSEVILLNYRACWNYEFINEYGQLFDNVRVELLPYHYYIPMLRNISKSDKIVSIGRSNSKCKIQYKSSELSEILKDKYCQIYPDLAISNEEFLDILNNYKYTLTGYYYGGEGNPEIPMIYNKLEWSFIDSFMAGAVPVTNTLFKDELDRLDIKVPLIDYRTMNVEDIDSKLAVYSYSITEEKYERYRSNLIRELIKGNYVINKMING